MKKWNVLALVLGAIVGTIIIFAMKNGESPRKIENNRINYGRPAPSREMTHEGAFVPALRTIFVETQRAARETGRTAGKAVREKK